MVECDKVHCKNVEELDGYEDRDLLKSMGWFFDRDDMVWICPKCQGNKEVALPWEKAGERL